MSSKIDRTEKISNSTIDYIVENMPNNGYAVIADKLNLDRGIVRNEIVIRKRLYNAEIINACLDLIRFVNEK